MKISISLSKAAAPWSHTDFKTIDVLTTKDLAQVMLTSHWAGIVWDNGKRRTENFTECSLCVLDFDDGKLTLEAAKEYFKELGFLTIIGTTKSHQVEPAVDRFRVVMQFELPITCSKQFSQNMQRLAKMWPCDRAALDAARKFAPCKEIVAIFPGEKIKVQEYVEPVKWADHRQFLKDKNQRVPRWINEYLASGIEAGKRNYTTYRIAKKLKEIGFNEGEVLVLLENSQITLPTNEVTRICRNAFQSIETR